VYKQFMRRFRREQQGFTLVELVVVVAILGILAVIFTPRVLDAMENARDNSARSTAKQIQLAMERFMVDNDQYPDFGATCANSDADQALECTGVDPADIAAALGTYASIDPANINDQAGIQYEYDPGARTYTLTITLVNPARTLTITQNDIQVQ
jgi:type IV pilus assembly protein PilA